MSTASLWSRPLNQSQ
uniref:Uncharacterized protein n=1 Tax=Anguilla anguilla TaxID=7936 RepID=A0A0E9R2V2_ANGAN